MKIVIVTTSLMRGGAEMQVFLLAREMSARGHDVHVVTMRDPESFEDELAAAGIPLTSLSMQRGVPNPRAIVVLAKLLRGIRPDVVHAHMVHANLLARITRLFARVPVLVSTAHSINEGGHWRDLAYRWTDGLSTITTNVCEAGVKRYIESGAVPARKIRRVVNGIEVARFERNPQAREQIRHELELGAGFVWLAVGSLDDVKDYPLMLRAFALLLESHPSAKLVVASDGPKRSELEAERDSLGLAQDVTFLGLRSDIAELMSAADAFVMTSKWEGLPMALLEASASSLPIVSTLVGGTDEVVLPTTGYLVRTRMPADVAAKMAHVMDLSPAARTKLGSNAHSHVLTNFELQDVVTGWLETYVELLEAQS